MITQTEVLLERRRVLETELKNSMETVEVAKEMLENIRSQLNKETEAQKPVKFDGSKIVKVRRKILEALRDRPQTSEYLVSEFFNVPEYVVRGSLSWLRKRKAIEYTGGKWRLNRE